MRNREAWHGIVHEVAKNQMTLATEQQQQLPKLVPNKSNLTTENKRSTSSFGFVAGFSYKEISLKTVSTIWYKIWLKVLLNIF